ncbi:MAG: hypothetical protein KA319_02135 [Ferruginibacter sp.]|nr:hypothetical protein [Ferruginibacter sp.]
MPNIFNDDFRDFIKILNKYDVEYILVGGYAVILNGYRRSTGDMDIWVNVTEENYKKLFKTFLEFGLHTTDFTKKNFLENKEMDVFSYGMPPVCIEILKSVKGVEFNSAYTISKVYEEDDLPIRFIHLNSLLDAKKAAGRHKDLDDIEKLTQ